MSSADPGLAILGAIRKQAEQAMRSKHCATVSASTPASGLLKALSSCPEGSLSDEL